MTALLACSVAVAAWVSWGVVGLCVAGLPWTLDSQLSYVSCLVKCSCTLKAVLGSYLPIQLDLE